MLSELELLRILVAIPSVSGSEAKIARFVEQFCREQGHDVFMVWGSVQDPETRRPMSDPATGRPMKNPSVAVHIKGVNRRRALIFNAHLDTVPGDWPDALTLEVTATSIIGLGVSDTKGNMAVMLMLAQLYGRYSPPPCDVWLFFSREEETTAQGSLDLVDWWAPRFLGRYTKSAVVIMEPTSDSAVCSRHKGGGVYHLRTKNFGAVHGSADLSNSPTAFDALVALGAAIKQLQERWKLRYASERYGEPTINVTGVETGNNVRNVVPGVIDVWVDIRTTDRLTPELLADELAVLKRYGVVLPTAAELAASGVVECTYADPILEAFKRGCPWMYTSGAFAPACDMTAFLRVGLPTVINGPGNMGIHQPEEDIDIGAMERHTYHFREVLAAFACAD